jgi:hypothetical protein
VNLIHVLVQRSDGEVMVLQ